MALSDESTEERTAILKDAAAELRKWALRMSGLVVLVLVVGFATYGYLLHRVDANSHHANIAAQRARKAANRAHRAVLKADHQASLQRSAIYGGCHRQNLRQTVGNRKSRASYRFYKATVTLFRFGLAQPQQPDASRESGVLFKRVLAQMVHSARTESWTPLSNCAIATNHPGKYVPAPAELFYRHPAPPTAFVIGPDE